MTVVITGCAGFIGSHVTEEFLHAGYDIAGVDCMTYASDVSNMSTFLSDIAFFKDDICDTPRVKDIVHSHKADWIINLAAETHVDNSIKSCDSFIYSNIFGTKSLLEVCKDIGCGLLQVSTDEVYGSRATGSFKELDLLSPMNPYSATKASSEHLIRAYHNTYGVQYKIVRMSNNFGPRQHSEKFIPTILKSLREGNRIPVYGTGENVRDWFYVKDCAAMLRDVHELGDPNETYNLTFQNERTNIDVVSTILRLLGKDFKSSVEFVDDRPGHDFRYSMDNSSVMKITRREPTPFELALKETIEAE